MSQIDREVRTLIATTVGTPEDLIARDASLRDLVTDSLSAVALIMALEDEFQIDIPDEEAAEIRTVKQLVEYVTFASAQQEAPLHRRLSIASAASRR